MLTIAHGFLGDNDKLLRGGVLAIVATMLTRLESDAFREHNLIPVSEYISSLLFSPPKSDLTFPYLLYR